MAICSASTKFSAAGGAARGRGGARGQRGADLRYDMSLSFEEAAAGVTSKIHLSRHEFARPAKERAPSPARACPRAALAAGAGRCPTQQGFFSITRTCPACQGAGQVIREACATCRGQGRIERERVLEVGVPAGVDSGTRLRMAGQGEPGTNGGPAGDLYIFLEVKEHAFFERRGSDLICEIPISFSQAALGEKIKVPTLKGEEELEIPEGTQSGQIFREEGQRPAESARRARRSLHQYSRGGAGESYARTAPDARAARAVVESRKQARRAELQLLRQSKRHLRVSRFDPLAIGGSG